MTAKTARRRAMLSATSRMPMPTNQKIESTSASTGGLPNACFDPSNQRNEQQ